MGKITISLVILMISLLSAQAVNADDFALVALGLCSQIELYTNQTADYTLTKCIPHLADGPRSIDFILVSEKPVFSHEDAKKAWLLVAVSAVGKVMNDHPDMTIENVIVSDANLMKMRKSYRLPGGLCKDLQRKLYYGEVTLDRAYATIMRAIKDYPPKK
jgi:hypothetical protein